jgi:hypothetical protein
MTDLTNLTDMTDLTHLTDMTDLTNLTDLTNFVLKKKHMKQQMKIFSMALLMVGIMSCGSATKITGSWINPDAKGKPSNNKSVFIASLSRNMEVRTKLEAALADEAAKHNIKAIKSTDYFTPEFYQNKPTKEQLLSQIKKTGADAILTVTLINRESNTRYVPGSAGYAPMPGFRWYGGFYSYYNYWYPYLYDPGYYVTDKTYFLETNLYDVDTEELIWSAQSQTVNPASIDQFVKDYPKKLVARMEKDGLLTNS